jgi:hypothetical protein
VLAVGSVHANVNGRAVDLDVPAQERAQRTLVPLRFVSEALGADVKWREAERTVLITDTRPAPTPSPTALGPEWFIELRSDPPGADIYLVSEYDWETIPGILEQIDQDPDLAQDQVEGPTNIEVQRPLVVYRAVFIRRGVKRAAPIQPVPIVLGAKRRGWTRFR